MSPRTLIDGELDPRPFALARIAVGLSALIMATVQRADARRLHDENGLLIPVTSLLPEPRGVLLDVLWLVWSLAAVGMVTGRAARASAALVAAAGTMTLALDAQFFSNHLLLLVLVAALLACARTDHAFVLGRPSAGTPVPAWPALLLMTQVSTVYVWTAIAKMNPSFLSGEVLEAYTRAPVDALPRPALQAMAVATIAAELALALALWHPRVTRAAVLAGVALHVGIVAFTPPAREIVPFALLMLAVYPVFLARAGVLPDIGRARSSRRRGRRRSGVLMERHRTLMDERGLTLVELLCVILVVGILAAIALPTLTGTSDKGRDATAKSAVRNLVIGVESCAAVAPAATPYADCATTDVTLLAGGDGYVVSHRSDSGTTFTWTRATATAAPTRTCDRPGEGACRTAGPGGQQW